MYAALTRAAVLDAARDLFISHGYEATTIDEIARHSQSSKGAVYHHFRDKREIFTEVFRASQEAVAHRVIDAISTGTGQKPWERIEIATRSCLRGFGEQERTLLRQAMGVLGWDRVRALDEEAALPFVRATLADYIDKGYARDVPVDAAAEIFFGVYYNAILYVAAASDPTVACRDAETVIFTALAGLKA
jgi:AcrR family transcriptional regulator